MPGQLWCHDTGEHCTICTVPERENGGRTHPFQSCWVSSVPPPGYIPHQVCYANWAATLLGPNSQRATTGGSLVTREFGASLEDTARRREGERKGRRKVRGREAGDRARW